MKYIAFGLVLLLILASCSDQQSTNNDTEIVVNSSGATDLEIVSEDADEIAGVPKESVNETKTVSPSYTFATDSGDMVEVHPISHATTVVEWGNTTIYVDPAEPTESYEGFDAPDMIFITHIHGDHLKLEVLEELYSDGVQVIVPESVHDELTAELQEYTTIIGRELTKSIGDFIVTTVPAYNIREEALNFHPESRNDNGYIIEMDGLRVYFSGDSEDTPEMRALTDIDIAFVSMNLPFTMTPESAASAVLDFTPKTVFPYHYRGRDGQSDVDGFKALVNEGNSEIEVVLHDWYAGE